MKSEKVSIVMLTYNAPEYIIHSIKGVKKYTENVNYELVVYDNKSKDFTQRILKKLEKNNLIDKLIFSDKNYFFVGGNNRAIKYVSKDSKYILLLNSDIEIRNKYWLENILRIHKKGITACQVCDEIDCRPDGWCLLVDKEIYLKYLLDEEKFTWYFSIADFASRVMKAGYNVQSIRNYQEFIIHFGGASEIASNISNLSLKDGDNVNEWFPHKCNVIEELKCDPTGNIHSNFILLNIFIKIKKKVKRIVKQIIKGKK